MDVSTRDSEFRNDPRRCRPLPPALVQRLSTLDDRRSALAVSQTLSVIAILRLRAICEHGAVDDVSSPLTAARTNKTSWWLRGLLFPHHVNYHIEHHLYPAIPHYHLPACHRELRDHGWLDQAEVRELSTTLARVFADPVPKRRPVRA